jgi:sulfotransferase
MKTIHFLAGLPRSGSSVLAAILNQNPYVYVTPTSPMLDLVVANQDTYWKSPAVQANPCPEQLTNVTRAMIKAMWEHRPESIIIDKNRGWGKNMPASTILFEREVKVIATIRDLPSIMASWLTLLRNNPNNYVDDILRQRKYEINDENRMGEMWFNMVKDCMECVKQLKIDAANRVKFLNYDDFVLMPNHVLYRIEEHFEIPHHDYDLNNIQSDTVDDDLTAWGLDGMHKVRHKLEKISKDPREVLGDMLYNRFVDIEKQYE